MIRFVVGFLLGAMAAGGLGACGKIADHPSHSRRATGASACTLRGTGAFTAPDDSCTPGAYEHLTRAASCAHKDRPQLPAADRRRVLSGYGVPGWTGRDGELDHRVPFFLGGLTTEDNVWPERGGIPNLKDRLEFYVYDRVCKGKPSPMRLRAARRIFLHDWRRAYRRYFP